MKPSDYHITLIKKILKGDESAFRELYDAYKQNLFLTCLRYAKNREIAQDYLQESFIRIYKNLHQFDADKGAIYTWMKRVTINVCLADLKKKTLYHVSLEEAYNSPTDAVDVLSKMSMDDMLAAVQTLPSGYRTVFNMYVIDGYTHREIAEELGISTGTSKSQLMKARKHLQKKILTNNTIITNLENPKHHRYG